MLQALFYKEWTKTKRILLLTAIVFAALVIYTFIVAGQQFRINGAVAIWSMVITKDMPLLPSVIQWLPVLASMLIGFSQFVPEMTDKRLKLTLHLPLPENKILSSMLLYGICVLFVLYLLTYAALIIGLSAYYPCEALTAMIWSSLPWFVGGLACYLFVAWVCLEPVWRQRIFNAFIAIAALSFFFIGSKSGAYITFLPYLMVVVVVAFSFPFYSAARFKDGAQ